MARRMPSRSFGVDPPAALAGATQVSNRNNKQEALARLRRTLKEEGIPDAEIDEIIGSAAAGYGDLPDFDDEDQDDDDGDDPTMVPKAWLKLPFGEFLERLRQRRKNAAVLSVTSAPRQAPAHTGMSFSAGGAPMTGRRYQEIWHELARNTGMLTHEDLAAANQRWYNFGVAPPAADMSLAVTTTETAPTPERVEAIADEVMKNRWGPDYAIANMAAGQQRAAVARVMREIQEGPTRCATLTQLASDVLRRDPTLRGRLALGQWLNLVTRIAIEEDLFTDTNRPHQKPAYLDGELSMTEAGQPMTHARAEQVASSLLANSGGATVRPAQRPLR